MIEFEKDTDNYKDDDNKTVEPMKSLCTQLTQILIGIFLIIIAMVSLKCVGGYIDAVYKNHYLSSAKRIKSAMQFQLTVLEFYTLNELVC